MTTMTPAPERPVSPPAPPSVGLIGPVLALARREMMRFMRQRGRIVGAVATPLLLWVMLGVGLNQAVIIPGGTGSDAATTTQAHAPGSFSRATDPVSDPRRIGETSGNTSGDASGGASGGVGASAQTDASNPPPARGKASGGTSGGGGYLAYFYPGMIVMVVLFTAIFSTISVIEDRKEGFLQAVLVSPASRVSIVLGKVLGGAGVAMAQGVVLLAAWPLIGPWPGWGAMGGAVVCLFLIAVGLTALGLCFAWKMDSSAAFHGVMSLVLMPMWLLCGAMFPLASAGLMKWVMIVNPLTYGYAAFAGLLMGPRAAGIGLPIAGPMAVVLTLAVLILAVHIARRPSRTGH